MAVLFHVDLAVALGADFLNDLAALADHVLDLIHGDGHAEHLGRILAQLCAGLGDAGLDDLIQDVQAALAALLQRFLNDVVGQAVDLDVHLNGGDAAAGAAHLKVHIAVEVLHALNVQHGHPAVALGDEAAADAGYRGLNGHARIHQGQGAAADGSLAGGAVGGQHLAHQTQGVREFLHGGNHRQQGALRQCAVADLAAAGAAGRPRLTHRVGREVVVMDVPLIRLGAQVVHQLAVLGVAQGAGGQHLGLAAGEHTAAVNPGQQAHLRRQRADLVDAAAVHTLAVIQQPAAHHVLLHLVHDQPHGGIVQVGVFGLQLVLNGQQTGIAHVLVVGVHGGLEVVQIFGADLGKQVVVQIHAHKVNLRLADLGHNAVDEGNDLLDLAVGHLDGLQHGGLIHLVGTRLDHHDLVHGGGHRQLQVAVLALLQRGVHHQLAIHQAHKHAADGALPGNLTDGQGNGGADHAGNLRAAVLIHAHHGHGHAYIIAHFLGEQRANGAVHHTAGENGLLAGAALTAHKAAGNAAHRVELFLKLHAQGEEVDALAGLLAHGYIAQHHGLAVAHQAAAVGEAAHLAGLHHKGAARQRGFPHPVIGEGFFSGTKFQSHVSVPPVLFFDT